METGEKYLLLDDNFFGASKCLFKKWKCLFRREKCHFCRFQCHFLDENAVYSENVGFSLENRSQICFFVGESDLFRRFQMPFSGWTCFFLDEKVHLSVLLNVYSWMKVPFLFRKQKINYFFVYNKVPFLMLLNVNFWMKMAFMKRKCLFWRIKMPFPPFLGEKVPFKKKKKLTCLFYNEKCPVCCLPQCFRNPWYIVTLLRGARTNKVHTRCMDVSEAQMFLISTLCWKNDPSTISRKHFWNPCIRLRDSRNSETHARL